MTHQIYPLPEPPKRPAKWPTAWIKEQHVDEYLKSLYSHGWGVIFASPALGQSEGVQSGARTPQLGRTFVFASYSDAIQFLSAIPPLETTEKHHVALRFTHAKQSEVSVFLHTHTAIRPRWEDEVELPDNVSDKVKAPGITLRDVRFAILLEKLYLQGAFGTPVPPKLRKPIERGSWSLLSQVFRYSLPERAPGRDDRDKPHNEQSSPSLTCLSCGGGHSLENCPVIIVDPASAPLPPHGPSARCLACLGPHSISQCPFHLHISPPNPRT